MYIPCICFDNDRIPEALNNKALWPQKTEIYGINHITYCTRSETLGINLQEIDTVENAPYLFFDIKRFIILDIKQFLIVMKNPIREQDEKISELLIQKEPNPGMVNITCDFEKVFLNKAQDKWGYKIVNIIKNENN